MQCSTRATGQFFTLAALAAIGATSTAAAAQDAAARTRVEEQVLLVAEPQTTYFVSPRGQHVAAVVNRGSRVVVVYDGVDGPRFDAMMPEIAFSDDGSRYAYVARLAQEFVYMVDGKELIRLPSTTHGVTQFGSNDPGFPKFDESGKRVYFVLESRPASGGNSQKRVYVDGRLSLETGARRGSWASTSSRETTPSVPTESTSRTSPCQPPTTPHAESL